MSRNRSIGTFILLLLAIVVPASAYVEVDRAGYALPDFGSTPMRYCFLLLGLNHEQVLLVWDGAATLYGDFNRDKVIDPVAEKVTLPAAFPPIVIASIAASDGRTYNLTSYLPYGLVELRTEVVIPGWNPGFCVFGTLDGGAYNFITTWGNSLQTAGVEWQGGPVTRLWPSYNQRGNPDAFAGASVSWPQYPCTDYGANIYSAANYCPGYHPVWGPDMVLHLPSGDLTSQMSNFCACGGAISSTSVTIPAGTPTGAYEVETNLTFGDPAAPEYAVRDYWTRYQDSSGTVKGYFLVKNSGGTKQAPPVISNLTVQYAGDSYKYGTIVAQFSTQTLTVGKIKYGLASINEHEMAFNTWYEKDHAWYVWGLGRGQTYYYEVIAIDYAGQQVSSGVGTVIVGTPTGNVAPVAQNRTAQTTTGTSVSITLVATDANYDPLTYSIVAGPSHGSLGTVNVNAVTYTPTAGYNGTDTFTFKAYDGQLYSNVATVTVTITPPNAAPVAQNVSVQTNANTGVDITLTATDGDSDPLTYMIVTGPAHGSLSGPAGNAVTYTPAIGYTGTDTFTFKANDGKADSNIATVTVTIIATGQMTIAFQNGVLPNASYAGCDDTWISGPPWDAENYGGENWGNGIGQYGGIKRSPIRFALTGMPAGVNVTSAKLRLKLTKTDGPMVIEAYQLLKPWTRMGATWNKYDGATAWTSPGAASVGNDRNGTSAGTLTVTNSDLNKWVEMSLCTCLVQNWVDGTMANHGVLLTATNEVTNETRYASETWVTVADRPMLVISYLWIGDVNADGSVDVVDLLYFVDAFGSVTGDPIFNAACDFNKDGSVDVVDLLMFVDNFGK